MPFTNVKPVVENVEVEPSGKYYFTCKVKIIEKHHHALWHEVQLVVTFIDRDRRRDQAVICRQPQIRRADSWVEIGGDFQVHGNSMAVNIEASIDHEDGDYLVDEPTLTLIRANRNWEADANQRIERARKNDIKLKVDVSSKYDPNKVEIKVVQLSHRFTFGTGVIAKNIAGDTRADRAYKEFIKEHFTMATIINAAKWRFMEPLENRPMFQTVDRAMQWLNGNGLDVRAHCICWGKETKVLPWLKKKNGQDVKEAVQSRIEYMLSHYKNKFAHLDVNNENLHGDWYEQNTGDRDITAWMLRTCHKISPRERLFCNDYGITGTGVYAMAYKRQVAHLRENGVPIHGMGLQAHLQDYPDMDRLAKRLNVLASANVPIWVTELDFRADDVNDRAQAYVDLIRLFFSHPRIRGIILWGFWEENIQFKTAALATGKHAIHLNEAGRRVFNLWKHEWRSRHTYRPKRRSEEHTMRVFKGEYRLSLYYDGEKQWDHDFTVDSSKAIELDVTV